MRLSKKSLTAMIAISIAMTVLPAAAILSNLPNRFDSDRPTNHISSKGDGTNAAKQDQYLEENQDSSTLKPSSNTSTSNDATVSSTSIFQTEDIDDNSIAIIGFNLDEENQAIEIPATINEKNVVMLKNENENACMPGSDKIKSLSLSDCGSISIDDWAFYQCTNLTSIDLSDCASVSIGTSAFAGCQKLTSANLTNSTSVGDFAFYQCSKLADSINLSGCTSIGNSSFEDCANISSVALPSKSYTIGNQAFFNCTSLTGTPNLSHCSSIGYYAFANCTKLTGALNLSRCSSIEKYAFSNCTGIRSVAFPTTPYIIEECAFANCIGITGPIDLSGCISIGENAFVNCSGITGSINLSNCTSVGKSAFAGCSGIASMTCPTHNVSVIPENCFSGCSSLKYFNRDANAEFNLTDITSIEANAFQNCTGITGSIDLSDCTSIGKNAFSGCCDLTSVIWPIDKVSAIPENCFSDCSDLKYFNRDANAEFNLTGITFIGVNAFQNCTGITGSVDLSDCASIERNAFDNCSNLYPTISTNTTIIDQDAFRNVPYVTITADNETALTNYCARITDNGYLIGLCYVNKVATLKDTPQNISIDPSNIASQIALDSNSTYYVVASVDSAYHIADYQTTAAYHVSLKKIDNGKTAPSIMSGTVPLAIKIPTDEYNKDRTYYLSDALASPINFTEEEDGYIHSCAPTLSSTEPNIIAIVSPNAKSISVTGETTLPYGIGSSTYDAIVTPTEAIQAVTWSSSNEDILKFDDKTSGTAAIVGAGTVTIKATATDGSNATSEPYEITINKAQPIITLNHQETPYTGRPVEMDNTVITLADGGKYTGTPPTYTYYSDAECQHQLKEAPTNACTYYVKASIPEQNNYNAAESAFAETLVITQATMPAPAAPQKESQTIDSITLKEIDTTVTEQGDPYHVQYGIVDENDQINWQDTPTFTNLIPGVDYTFYIRYALTGTVNPDNYTSSISVSKSADFRIEQPSPPAEGTGFTIDYVSETIFIEDGYEAATDPDFPEQARLNSGNHITPDTIIYVRTAATADAPASDSTANKIAPRPVAPTDRPVIKQNGKTIEVQNPVDTQEYLLTKTPSTDHSAEFDVWQDSPVFTDDTMSAGDTYTVSTRIKATETSFSSDPISSGPLTIGEHAHQVKLDGGNTGENWTPSDGTTYDDGYDIPTKLYIEGHPVYQVQLDWGDMALVYDMRSSSKGWGDSFDGENNIITVTNQSSEAIDATLSLDITETNLGFSPQLVAQNAIENDVTNPSVSDTVKQLASGNSGNTQSAYINLEHENDQPSVEYNSQTNIGAITVTIQKSDSD